MSETANRTKTVVKYVVYTDGACKNNHCSAHETQRKRMAGSAFVALEKVAHVDRVLSDIFEQRKCSGADLAHWRTLLVQAQAPFVGAACRDVPLPLPVTPPNKVSNNRAELHALNSALAHFLAHRDAQNVAIQMDICIKVDSEYVMKVFGGAKQWQQNKFRLASGMAVSNADYVQEMLLYLTALRALGHIVFVEHVPAHLTEDKCCNSFHTWVDWFGNDVADRLSNVAAGAQSDVNYSGSSSGSRSGATKGKKRKRKS